MDDSIFRLDFAREVEFPQLKNNTYLDYAGASLYGRQQIEAFAEQAKTTMFANPHSRHTVSQATSIEVANVRNRVLRFFNTDAANYSVIFTSGATAAMKLVAESFDYGPAGLFSHLREVHTSVLGMGAVAKSRGARTICFEEEQIDSGDFFRSSQGTDEQSKKLVVFPGLCNFSGRKYSLEWVKKFSDRGWKVFLDAAALVSTSSLDLTETPADFVALSFYKIFGFPTGIGALLVRKSAEDCLKKTYFGGGAVELAVGETGFHAFRADFVKRMEDGTLPFLDIIALNHGFDALDSLGGGMSQISRRTFALAQYTWQNLKLLWHTNGRPAVDLYCWDDTSDWTNQGPIVAFNLRDPQGGIVGFTAVEKVAESFSLQLRTGCFCNTGACQKYLGLTTDDLIGNFRAGHVCGDNRDLINGKPTGAIRVSFGYMSTKADADSFLQLMRDVFVEKATSVTVCTTGTPLETFPATIPFQATLRQLFVYPVKSCQGVQTKESSLGPDGLLHDRQCFIQNSAGTSITLKHNPKLSHIIPSIDSSSQQLSLSAPGMPKIVMDNGENGDSTSRNVPDLTNARVCGRQISSLDCGPHASQWLSDYLKDDIYTLKRFNAHTNPSSRSGASFPASAANSAPFLLICTASLEQLLESVPAGHFFTQTDLIRRMRPNMVCATRTPFEEDTWQRLRIGEVEFDVVEKCARCQMINVNGEDGRRTSEPLQTLIRLRGKEMNFGILLRLTPRDGGSPAELSLREGDTLHVLSTV